MSELPKRQTILLHLRLEDQLFSGIIEACRQLGWRVINLEYTSDFIPPGRSYAGAILDDSISNEALDRILGLNVPVVMAIEDEREVLADMQAVVPDWYAIGRLAAEAFADRGFKDIGTVAFAEEYTGMRLVDGLRDGVKMIPDGNLHICFVDNFAKGKSLERYESHVKAISDWVRTMPLPLGVFGFNHRMGARIVTAAEMAGLSVPEQVAVLVAGNRETSCETAPVPLSAIDDGQRVRGKRMVQQLKAILEGKRPTKKPILIPPTGIVERRSTDILAVPDARVATAIRFMWDHYDWPITVDDVAFHIGTSRTTLERSFRKCLGRGVIAELRRKRLERCKELLRGTNMTIPEITKAIGLNDKRYLHRAFKESFGETPRQYRARHYQQQATPNSED